jgi:hypothetical protein
METQEYFDNNANSFLDDYIDLLKKYENKIYIGGCGCCDSPYLYYGDPDSREYSYYSTLDLYIKHLKRTVEDAISL